jgi:hypothetical protein
MASELDITVAFTFDKGTHEEFSRAATFSVTVSGNRYFHNIQSIGITEEALNLGDLTSPFGVAWFRNLDETNYVEIRLGTGASNDIIRLNAGEAWPLRLGSDVSAPYAIANTAAVDLEIVVFQP